MNVFTFDPLATMLSLSRSETPQKTDSIATPGSRFQPPSPSYEPLSPMKKRKASEEMPQRRPWKRLEISTPRPSDVNSGPYHTEEAVTRQITPQPQHPISCAIKSVNDRVHNSKESNDRRDVKTRFLIVSDTHAADFSPNRQPSHQADVAIHCGDLTDGSSLEEFRAAIRLLKGLKAPLKLILAGNHDFSLDQSAYEKNFANFSQELVANTYGHYGDAKRLFEEAKDAGIVLLDEAIDQFSLENGAQMKLYASPFTPSCGDWGLDWGFQYRPGDGHDFAIEEGTDIVITHGPPRGILDYSGKRVGCPELFRAIAQSRPRLHCFGHVHKSWGAKLVTWKDQLGETPSHFDAIDNDRSVVIETLTGLTEAKYDTPETLREKKVKLERYTAETCYRTSHCAEDATPVKYGQQTLFINAAIKGNTEELPEQLPWLVDIELPRTSKS